MFYNIAAIALALICVTSALPNGPSQKLCPQSISTDYRDLTTLPPGTPGPLTPVKNPYLGLDYSSSWAAVQGGNVLKPGSKNVFFDLQTKVLRPPNTISADQTNCAAASYRLKSFNWYAVEDAAQPDATLTIDATLKVTGTTADGRTVTASCNYKGGQVNLPIFGDGAKSLTCTLPASFDYLTDAKYEVTSAIPTPATASIHITQYNYVLYKCC